MCLWVCVYVNMRERSKTIKKLSSSLGDGITFIYSFCLFMCFGLFRGTPWHMEVPRLGVESELQLPAYITATQDLSCICDLHHNSRQCQIFSPLSKARDPTCILMHPSWVHYHCATLGTLAFIYSFILLCILRIFLYWVYMTFIIRNFFFFYSCWGKSKPSSC